MRTYLHRSMKQYPSWYLRHFLDPPHTTPCIFLWVAAIRFDRAHTQSYTRERSWQFKYLKSYIHFLILSSTGVIRSKWPALSAKRTVLISQRLNGSNWIPVNPLFFRLFVCKFLSSRDMTEMNCQVFKYPKWSIKRRSRISAAPLPKII